MGRTEERQLGRLISRDDWIVAMPPPVQDAILSRMAVRELGPGETLKEAGDAPYAIFQVEYGLLKLSRLLPDGKLRLVVLYGKGATFGETALVVGRFAYDHTTIALVGSRVRTLASTDFDLLAARHPEINAALCRKFAQVVATLLVRQDETVSLRLRCRLAVMFVSLAEDLGRQQEDGRVSFMLPISHADIAEHVNATRQAVQRELSAMTSIGVMERRGNRWSVLDLHRLRALQGMA